MHRGEDEIKHQKYFEAIDWESVGTAGLPPPWVPALEHAADIAYVPRRVTDRRAASIADEFHDWTAGAASDFKGSSDLAPDGFLAGDDEEIRRLRSNNAWKDFSFSAPLRGNHR